MNLQVARHVLVFRLLLLLSRQIVDTLAQLVKLRYWRLHELFRVDILKLAL